MYIHIYIFFFSTHIEELAHGGCVDSHLQDQLIILMALAKGKRCVLRVTYSDI